MRAGRGGDAWTWWGAMRLCERKHARCVPLWAARRATPKRGRFVVAPRNASNGATLHSVRSLEAGPRARGVGVTPSPGAPGGPGPVLGPRCPHARSRERFGVHARCRGHRGATLGSWKCLGLRENWVTRAGRRGHGGATQEPLCGFRAISGVFGQNRRKSGRPLSNRARLTFRSSGLLGARRWSLFAPASRIGNAGAPPRAPQDCAHAGEAAGRFGRF